MLLPNPSAQKLNWSKEKDELFQSWANTTFCCHPKQYSNFQSKLRPINKKLSVKQIDLLQKKFLPLDHQRLAIFFHL